MFNTNRRLNELIGILRREAPQDTPVYMVGGAVRDILRGQPVHDLDMVLAGDIRTFARRVANRIHGDFYMLDEKRETARVIDHSPEAGTIFIDFCTLRADSLEVDLLDRDFSVNAIAFDLSTPEQLIDPSGGIKDMREKVLRAPSDQAFQRDPVRVLRGVRLAINLGFQLEVQSYDWMRQAVKLLPRVSHERQRDELFRMLGSGKAPDMVRLLEQLGALDQLLPELATMKGISQSPPHTLNVWEHTLRVIDHLEDLWALLVAGETNWAASNAYLQLAGEMLGNYLAQLADHFEDKLNPNRSPGALLFLAALYHDVAKPQTRSVDPGGRIRFYTHENAGAELATRRARMLALSQVEIQRLALIVSGHMRVHQISQPGQAASRRAIYRFFRDYRKAGVDIVLLSLADTLGTYEETLPLVDWKAELCTAKALLEAWFEQPAQSVKPPRLLNGNELVAELQLPPGPAIGRLLDALEEAQASGEVITRQQALDYIRAHFSEILAGSSTNLIE